MRIRLGSRRSGRTSYAIDRFLVDPDNSIMIVPDARQKAFVQSQLKLIRPDWTQTYYNRHIITWDSRRLLRGLKQKKILIDNLDMILAMEFGPHELNLATMEGITV